MIVINPPNVNQALPSALAALARCEVIPSRYGPVRRAPAPVATVYEHPRERVLFDPERNANPFFHFFEALWILAGRRDVQFLEKFNPRMREFSDNGVDFHAPYGWRLREHYGVDQVETVIDMLRRDSSTRRAVLQIWDTRMDLNKTSKDLPCNDIIFLTVREDGLLYMTVCCRSNDAIWGAYGANVVQFSMLQEYLAARIYAGVGTYTQISHDFHVYEELPFWQEHLKKYAHGYRPAYDPYEDGTMVAALCHAHELPYEDMKPVQPYDLFTDPEFDNDLRKFFEHADDNARISVYRTDVFNDVVLPLFDAWLAHKEGDYAAAMPLAEACAASDWRLAARLWLKRRADRA